MLPVSPVLPGSNLPEIKVAENQPEYMTLPVVLFDDGTIVSRWHLDDAELKVVEQTGELYINLLTFGQEPPTTLFQVDNPMVGETPEENLSEKTCYFGSGLPVVAQDANSIWLLLELTDNDRATLRLNGDVYFFMKTKGKPITPSLIQVEKPFMDDVQFMIGIRAGANADAIGAQYKIEFAAYDCCICNHKTVVSRTVAPRIEQNGLKVICKPCTEDSGMQICVAPETVEEFRQVLETEKNSQI